MAVSPGFGTFEEKLHRTLVSIAESEGIECGRTSYSSFAILDVFVVQGYRQDAALAEDKLDRRGFKMHRVRQA